MQGQGIVAAPTTLLVKAQGMLGILGLEYIMYIRVH